MRILLLPLLIALACCRTGDSTPDPTTPAGAGPAEAKVKVLTLTGPLADPDAEVSGLAWHGAELVLLPQYPDRVGDSVYTVSRSALDAAIDGSEPALKPRPVPLIAPGMEGLDGFQGYEAIAFDGDTAWVTIECELSRSMLGWLVKGTMADGKLVLDPATRTRLVPLAPIGNMAFEAVVVTPEGPVAFYEANGVASSPEGIRPGRESLVLPRIPFRVTDATDVQDGKFWVINYFWPENDKIATPDTIAARHGQGASHARSEVVERLVELELGAAVSYTDTPPIQLELGDEPRNWEGIARHRDGFVIVTDKFPTTIIGFVRPPTADAQ